MIIWNLAFTCISILPNAIDGLKANGNSVKVEANFSYGFALFDWNYTEDLLKMHKEGFEPITRPALQLRGSWGCDGRVERFMVKERLAAWDLDVKTHDPYEALFDGQIFAYYWMNPKHAGIEVRRTNVATVNVFGPFAWWLVPFNQVIEVEYSRQPGRTEKRHYGKELYNYLQYVEPVGETRNVLDVFCDPSWNFVPRYARISMFDAKNDIFVAKDVVITKVQQCKAGGFFPTEWFDRFFSVRKFSSKYGRNYDSFAVQGEGKIKLGHFKVESYSDITTPVSLSIDASPRPIGGLGGFVVNDQSRPTLADLTSHLGKKIDQNPSGLKLNSINPEKETQKSYRSSRIGLVGFGVVSLVSFSVLMFRLKLRTKQLLLLWPLLCLAGCDRTTNSTVGQPGPLPKLTVVFDPAIVFCKAQDKSLESSIVVKNFDTKPIIIYEIDGGCSCRNVEKSSLPITIDTNGHKQLGIKLSRKEDYQDQHIQFSLSTSKGKVTFVSGLTIIPEVKIIPENISLVLNENDTASDKSSQSSVTVRAATIISQQPPYFKIQALSDLLLDSDPSVESVYYPIFRTSVLSTTPINLL